jgi:hypothetical protein
MAFAAPPPKKECFQFTRTLTLKQSFPKGLVLNAVGLGLIPTCVSGQEFRFEVTTQSGTDYYTYPCEGVLNNGVSAVSDEPIQSVTITSTYDDYLLAVVVAGFTTCSSPPPTQSPSLRPKGGRGSKA